MNKIAFITGINGQDGSYLAEYLLSLGYEVHGMVRRQSTLESQTLRLEKFIDEITLHYGDITDQVSLITLIDKIKPDEIYDLAGMSHVRVSFDMPHYALQANGLGVLNILEAYKQFAPQARFYQASSSEMFGNNVDKDKIQRITTPMNPASPYGCGKLLGYNLVKHYRKAYGLHASNGILFNHESPRRGINFVTNKVVKTAVEIKRGSKNQLRLGNLDAHRDWGHAKDYVRAMHIIVSQDEPDDVIVATGKAYSVRDLCKYVFSSLDLNYEDFVVKDPQYFRPEDIDYLRGDAEKIKSLGWEPEYTFETMLDEMIASWQDYYRD